MQGRGWSVVWGTVLPSVPCRLDIKQLGGQFEQGAALRDLADVQIRPVSRRQELRLDDGSTLLIHLGMSGSLRVLPTSTPPGRGWLVQWPSRSICRPLLSV